MLPLQNSEFIFGHLVTTKEANSSAYQKQLLITSDLMLFPVPVICGQENIP